MKKICLLLFLLCACIAQAQNAYRTNKDISYVSGSETDTYRLERCKLDIYYPENKKDFSTIVWFHGGGMEGGNKFIPKELREQGFAVVAVNYRLSPKAKNPAYIEDAAEAVAWVFKNIEKYGGRKDHIFVSGHSAGGYLSLILAMDKKYMAAYGADADSVAAYLQALVGQMYDDPKYSSLRDSGFQIFYMFINIGGFFAPWIAIGVRNWWLKVNNFDYDATLPELCHQFLKEGDKMAPQAMENLTSLAEKVTLDGSHVADMGAFVNNYLDVFNRGFQYAFMAAIVAMLISLVIYLANKKRFPDPAKKVAAAKEQNTTVSKEEIKMSAAEIKQRIYALFAVFGVVIFFWLSFHQNGYSLTYFARDYVDLSVIDIDLGFTRIKGAEIFQCVNPFFVVFLTPFIMWLFGSLKKTGKSLLLR